MGLLPSFRILHHYLDNDQIDCLGYFMAKEIRGRENLTGYPEDELTQFGRALRQPLEAEQPPQLPAWAPSAEAQGWEPGVYVWGPGNEKGAP